MGNISINISEIVYSEILSLAKKKHCSLDECILSALNNYINEQQDAYMTDLNVVNSEERSFFFSAGE